MRRKDYFMRDDLSRRRPATGRLFLAGSATVLGLFTVLFLAGCGPAMSLVALVPTDPAAAYESELEASLGLDAASRSPSSASLDGPKMDFTGAYDDSANSTATAAVATAGAYGSSYSEGSGSVRIVHADDYLGDSTDVGRAFTRAVVDDANSRYGAESVTKTISLW